jgi:ubiquinone/menaquinone biosynthesis C-methylase UbiE
MSTQRVSDMSPLRVDYMCPQVAAGFDLRGVVSSDRVDRLAAFMEELLNTQPYYGEPKKILDIGCGTGRFTIPFAERFPNHTVLGADKSSNMLAQAQQKQGANRVLWSVQDICSQGFDSESFNLVFVSDLLHHIANPLDAIRECRRVLRPGGWLLCKYGAMDKIAQDPEHLFFPETVAIDAARTPTQEMVGDWLVAENFRYVNSQTLREQTRISGADRLAAARAKSISVLHMIEQDHFDKGLKALALYVEQNPYDPWLREDPTTWTWGQR